MSDADARALADEILRQETALAEGRAVDIGGYLLPKAPEEPRCLISPAGCPTPREQDLLRHAQAMDYALTHVRLLAHASRDGMVPGSMLLKVLSKPYRFPLPGDAAALAAYRAVFGEGNLAIEHLADCGRCNPVGYDRDFCPGYGAAARADHEESLRERGRG